MSKYNMLGRWHRFRRTIKARFIPKDEHHIVLIPHFNASVDHYDLINYHSDNVLALANAIIRDPRFNGWHLTLIIHDVSKEESYREYVHGINPDIRIDFLQDTRAHARHNTMMRAKYCFTDNTYHDYYFKTKDQIVVSLGYFTPFKNDYYINLVEGEENCKEKRRVLNRSFDYDITTSDFASRVISTDNYMAWHKFLPLGFPRNDTFYDEEVKRQARERLQEAFGFPVEHFIFYTPTFRDYRHPKTPFYKPELDRPTTEVFGYESADGNQDVKALLEETKSVIIIKGHPQQHLNLEGTSDRIVDFYERFPDSNLYYLLAAADGLITDYTSTCFDFMHTRKPILYNFYDYEQYRGTRGFCIDPIEPLCAGTIARTRDEFVEGLASMLRPVQANETGRNTEPAPLAREDVRHIVNKHYDGNSAQRIIDFFFPVK